jgi:hypothetical protein
MSDLLSLFVHQPLRLLAIAGTFLALWVAVGRARALLAPAAYFVLFAAWEWLVMTRTPEANIRVDLLVLWPAGLALTAWAIVRTLRR